MLLEDKNNHKWQELKLAICNDKLLYLYAIVSTSSLYLIYGRNSHHSIDYDLFAYLSTLKNICLVSFLGWSLFYFCSLAFNKEPYPVRKFSQHSLNFLLNYPLLISSLMLLLTLNIVFSCYTYLKAIIPDIAPFKYDLLFYEVDKLLHFGRSPWEITHFVFSSAYMTLIINLLYNLWFFIMWAAVLFFIFKRDLLAVRLQFLLTFFCSWLLLGGVVATFLSSAGPCYTYLLDSTQTHFLPLLERLDTQSTELLRRGLVSLWSINTQDMLWDTYLSREHTIGAGISAMPSMHVAIATLMALAASKVNRTFGYLMWGYAACIQIGSVHLAWHYAIDGYVSIVLTIVLWKLVGTVTSKSTHHL